MQTIHVLAFQEQQSDTQVIFYNIDVSIFYKLTGRNTVMSLIEIILTTFFQWIFTNVDTRVVRLLTPVALIPFNLYHYNYSYFSIFSEHFN